MNENKISFIKFLPGLAWFFIVDYSTLMPGKDVPDVGWFYFPQMDKLVHIILFGGLTLLFCLPYLKTNYSFQKKKNIFIRISLCIILWGLIIEVIQHFFIPGRGFEWLDVLADSVGVLIAYWICLKISQSKNILVRIPFF
ncbi:MAG: VanZ family protein [Ginsengibacter sp.]